MAELMASADDLEDILRRLGNKTREVGCCGESENDLTGYHFIHFLPNNFEVGNGANRLNGLCDDELTLFAHISIRLP